MKLCELCSAAMRKPSAMSWAEWDGRRFCSRRCKGRAQTVAAFARNVDCSGGAEACWPWTGALTPKGYGRFAHGRAHRYAYKVAHGPIPNGCVVAHTCDNPPCCNPAHLRAWTQLANVRDAQAKGRLRGNQKGKISVVEAREIVALFDLGRLTQKQIGVRYGVHQATVQRIIADRERRAA